MPPVCGWRNAADARNDMMRAPDAAADAIDMTPPDFQSFTILFSSIIARYAFLPIDAISSPAAAVAIFTSHAAMSLRRHSSPPPFSLALPAVAVCYAFAVFFRRHAAYATFSSP